MNNQLLTICEVKVIKKSRPAVISLYFSDGSRLVVPESYRPELQHISDDVKDLHARLETLQRAQNQLADELATRYLRVQDRSVKQLNEYLQSFEFDKTTIHALIERYKQLGYLNDERYALQFVEKSFLQKKKPLAWIRLQLLEKGIAPEWIESAFESFCGDDERAQADAALKKKFGPNWAEQRNQFRKMQSYLYRNGYSEELIAGLFSEE